MSLAYLKNSNFSAVSMASMLGKQSFSRLQPGLISIFWKRLIQHFGFLYVKDKVVPARACDTALSAAFGSGWDATEPNVLAALDSYINELRSLPVNLLTNVD
jgi:hypothetical protein